MSGHHHSSSVWKHFQKQGDGSKTSSTHCGDVLQYKTGKTIVMKRHLEGKHSILQSMSVKRKNDEVDDKQPALKRSTPSISPGISSFFSSPKPAEKVTSLVVNMIVQDLLPIATVEHSGFRKRVSFLAPGYTLPTRK